MNSGLPERDKLTQDHQALAERLRESEVGAAAIRKQMEKIEFYSFGGEAWSFRWKLQPGVSALSISTKDMNEYRAALAGTAGRELLAEMQGLRKKVLESDQYLEQIRSKLAPVLDDEDGNLTPLMLAELAVECIAELEGQLKLETKRFEEQVRDKSRISCVYEDQAKRLRQRIAELEKQLPESMRDCTILLKECDKGHRWLTAMHWTPFDCPTCVADEDRQRIAALKAEQSAATRELRLYVEANGFQWQEDQSWCFNATTAIGWLGGALKTAKARIAELEGRLKAAERPLAQDATENDKRRDELTRQIFEPFRPSPKMVKAEPPAAPVDIDRLALVAYCAWYPQATESAWNRDSDFTRNGWRAVARAVLAERSKAAAGDIERLMEAVVRYGDARNTPQEYAIGDMRRREVEMQERFTTVRQLAEQLAGHRL